MTDREKIIKIIEKNGTYNGRSFSFDYYVIQPDDIADTLLAANIGDVTEWKERAEKAENALKEGIKCISPLQSAGFTINPVDVLRDSTKCITIAQRALFNMTKKYILAERKIATTKDGQPSFSEKLIALFAGEAIKQAEREIEEEGKDE